MKLWFGRGAWASKKGHRMAASMEPESVRKIAVIRHAALGDLLLTRPFLIELRKAFPNAIITLSAVSNYTRGMPEDLIDRVHIVAARSNKELTVRQKIQQFKELGEQDIIFDLAVTNRSMKTCLLNKAKLKIGFPYNSIQARLVYDVATPRSDLNFELSDMLMMLNVLGIKTAYPHQFNLPGEALKRDKPYLIYFPGASSLDKCWPSAHFSELMRDLSERYPNHEHLVLEGIQEWEKADPILEPLQDLENVGSIIADNIEDTTKVIKGAELVVSNDTGIRHLAIAAETPTVGIFFRDPFRYWPRYDIHDIAIPDPDWPPSVDAVQEACLNVLGRGAS
ncbi:MAG: glycosyltransferase family 9 protein [Motiliproteus sp.]